MVCKKCGAEVNEGAEFCSKCGQKMIPDGEKQNTKGIDSIQMATLVILAIHIICFICYRLFAKLNYDEFILANSGHEMSKHAAEMVALTARLCFCGGLFVISSILFLLAILKKSERIYITGIIAGIILSIISLFGIPYSIFYILLFLKNKGKNIKNGVLIVLAILFSLLLIYESNSNLRIGFSLYGLYLAGLAAWITSNVLLVLVTDKKVKA